MHIRNGFGAMKIIAGSSGTRARIRLILAVLVAVVASMTMHHGAMARSNGLSHAAAAAHHHASHACIGSCEPERHSMPVCCGMGLCLSGMPAAPITTLPPLRPAIMVVGLSATKPQWPLVRIDRPPKDFLQTA